MKRFACTVLFLLSSQFSLAADFPFYYKNHAEPRLHDMSRSLAAVNSQGEYFLLKLGTGPLLKLSNTLVEERLFEIPAPYQGSHWYNEIAIGRDDNVWISHNNSAYIKTFLKFDSSGNFLRALPFYDPHMMRGAHTGFAFDSENNLFFMHSHYEGHGQPFSSWLVQVDSETGVMLKEWPVPVDPPSNWGSALTADSQGNMLWGNFSSDQVYRFTPPTELTELFSTVPLWSHAQDMSFGFDDYLFVLEPSNTYHGNKVFVMNSQGTYDGKSRIDFGVCGFGIAAFFDEVLITSKDSSMVIKYGVATIAGIISRIERLVRVDGLGEHRAGTLIHFLEKAQKNMDNGSARHTEQDLRQFIKMVRQNERMGNIASEEAAQLIFLADFIIGSLSGWGGDA
jgi:hypothetical protein